tara:strand:- start:281 stop:781 length:501 start_codon:yes stop_codon:yes gene_type:complete
MVLTKKQKEILENACKRSSPMVVRKQLKSAFGAWNPGLPPGLEYSHEPPDTPTGYSQSVGSQTYSVNNDEIRADIEQIVNEKLNEVNNKIHALNLKQSLVKASYSKGMRAQRDHLLSLRRHTKKFALRRELSRFSNEFNRKFRTIMDELRKLENKVDLTRNERVFI